MSCYTIAAEDAGSSDALQEDASMGGQINAEPLVSEGMYVHGIARIASNCRYISFSGIFVVVLVQELFMFLYV